MTPAELDSVGATLTHGVGFGLEYWWRAQPALFSTVGILVVLTLVATVVSILLRK